jgi:3-methyladenine DNA glycosylase AlkD
MLHPQKARVGEKLTPVRAAREAKRALARMARPAGDFDSSRYFRGPGDLGFYNVGTAAMRELARSIHAQHKGEWSIDDAMAFAGALIEDRYLEAKSVGIEVVARYRGDFTPRLLAAWRRWLADNHSANWATTDAMCGVLIGPLLLRHPELGVRMRVWARDCNMWVRRASIVGLIQRARRGESLDLVYEIARRLHKDQEDLIQKAVGWALREAGKTDMVRLERYLRANGSAIPRTTLRYAIERFPPAQRKAILLDTREGGPFDARPELVEGRGRGRHTGRPLRR